MNYRKITPMYRNLKRSYTNKGLAFWRRRKCRIHICTYVVTKAKFKPMSSWISCTTGGKDIIRKTELQFCYNFYQKYWWMQFTVSTFHIAREREKKVWTVKFFIILCTAYWCKFYEQSKVCYNLFKAINSKMLFWCPRKPFFHPAISKHTCQLMIMQCHL